jgi:hypothetical protein
VITVPDILFAVEEAEVDYAEYPALQAIEVILV